jgi:tetratricopeptide (TPR) repeat protein
MAWVGGFMLVAFLATVVSALLLGVLNPSAPRTAVERDLARTEMLVESKTATATAEDWYRYTTALVSSGQYGKAERMIRIARDGGFEDPAKQYLGLAEVRLDLARGDYEKVIEHSDAAISALEAQLEIEKKQFEATKKPTVMIAEGLGENYETLLLNRAEAFEELGRLNEAIAELDKYLEKNSRAADILVWRGDLKAASGDTEGAIADYTSASAYMPGDEALADKLNELGAN